MHVGVLVQALGIRHVAGGRVETVEAAVGRIVPAGSVVLPLGSGVEVFAGVAEAGQASRTGYGDGVVTDLRNGKLETGSARLFSGQVPV